MNKPNRGVALPQESPGPDPLPDDARYQALGREAFALLARGVALAEVLTVIVRGIEARMPGAIGGIMILDEPGRSLRSVAVPGLPDFFCAAVDGLPVADGVGSCGTAAARGERVIVEDIQTHPFCTQFRDLAQRAGVVSCWSEPIFDPQGRTIGILALYHRVPSTPGFQHLKFIAEAVGLASVAIVLHRQQAALRQNETLLRTVIDENPGIIILKDWNGRFLLGNQTLARLYGTTTAELVGKDDGAFNANAEQVRSYLESLREVIRGGVTRLVLEASTDAATGDVRHYQSIKKPLVGEDGEPRLLIIASDVTDLHDARERLAESQKQLNFLLAAIGEGVWDWNVTRDEVSHNLRWCEIMGLDETYLKHPSDGFLNLIVPEDRDAVAARVGACLAGKGSYFSEHRMRHRDGHTLWVRDRGDVVEFDESGKAIRMVGSVADITEARAIGIALRESQARYQHVFDHVQEVIFQTDDAWRWQLLNPAWTDITGHPVEASLASPFLDYVHPDDRDHKRRDLQALADRVQDSCHGILRMLHRDGSFRWVEVFIRAMTDKEGALVGTSGTLTDVTLRVAAEEHLRLTASVFRHAHEGIVITDPEASIVEVNDTFCAITGYSREEVIGRNTRFLRSGHQGSDFYADMWRCLLDNGVWQGEMWNRKKNGELYAQLGNISAVRDERGRITHYVGLFSDITALKESQRHLEHLAYHDALTQLPNRSLLADRMHMALAQAERSGTLAAVAYLDLDGFKPVNDSLGHDTGDWLLVEIAHRLQASTRAGDTVARMGGDEFALIYNGLEEAAECEQVFQRLLDSIAEPFSFQGREIRVAASIGVTLFPLDGSDPDTLLRHADQAMYLAKQAGGNCYQLFGPERDRRLRAHREALVRVESALYDGELELHYQPKVDVRDNCLVGVEALIRWRHPERGLLLPAEFLPDVTETDFEVGLGDWVLATAIAQLQTFCDAGHVLPLSINVSPGHLANPRFVPYLKGLLDAHPRLPSGLVELEILESTSLGDIGAVAAVMAACKTLGVSFALDDFGTGYASLTYLRRLPVRAIKIDQSFVRDMLEDSEDLAIVQGVIGLAAAFHREVIAEGVETAAHRKALLDLGCHLIQGFGVARPMTATQLLAWIKERDASG